MAFHFRLWEQTKQYASTNSYTVILYDIPYLKRLVSSHNSQLDVFATGLYNLISRKRKKVLEKPQTFPPHPQWNNLTSQTRLQTSLLCARGFFNLEMVCSTSHTPAESKCLSGLRQQEEEKGSSSIAFFPDLFSLSYPHLSH